MLNTRVVVQGFLLDRDLLNIFSDNEDELVDDFDLKTITNLFGKL